MISWFNYLGTSDTAFTQKERKVTKNVPHHPHDAAAGGRSYRKLQYPGKGKAVVSVAVAGPKETSISTSTNVYLYAAEL
jgi:hypothetical protein